MKHWDLVGVTVDPKTKTLEGIVIKPDGTRSWFKSTMTETTGGDEFMADLKAWAKGFGDVALDVWMVWYEGGRRRDPHQIAKGFGFDSTPALS